MTRRRNLLLWFSFAAIPLTALGIVLVVALKPLPTEASRRIKKIQQGVRRDQVEAAIGNPRMIEEPSPFHSWIGWGFSDGSELWVRFGQDLRVDGPAVASRPIPRLTLPSTAPAR